MQTKIGRVRLPIPNSDVNAARATHAFRLSRQCWFSRSPSLSVRALPGHGIRCQTAMRYLGMLNFSANASTSGAAVIIAFARFQAALAVRPIVLLANGEFATYRRTMVSKSSGCAPLISRTVSVGAPTPKEPRSC